MKSRRVSRLTALAIVKVEETLVMRRVLSTVTLVSIGMDGVLSD